MLNHLHVRDFAIIDRIDIDFDAGMTVLTGETGAGKSILVDALGLVLGDRGGAQLVRSGARRAEFSAAFDASRLPEVQRWLQDQTLDQDGDCLLRRVINADGRSRAYINGTAVPVQQLKLLGDLLVDIHGQHFHQSLVRRNTQRDLVDFFGGLIDTRDRTTGLYQGWQALVERRNQLLAADADRASRLDFIEFQIAELESLGLGPREFEALSTEREKLRHSGRIAAALTRAGLALTEDDSANVTGLLADASRAVEGILDIDSALVEAHELLRHAEIQVSEAVDMLNRYAGTIDMDPARREWVEDRLDAITGIARKHRVPPNTLTERLAELKTERGQLSNAEALRTEVEQDAAAAEAKFRKLAMSLSRQRRKAAEKFSAAVTETMAGLGMPGGVFEAAVRRLPDDEVRSWGIDAIEFLISANPGQDTMPLARVASGGELSRMSLAIQVIASNGSRIPTMVFDEVDSGVGGRVAEMVGRRLRELGARRQVLCVTHLPQVASLAAQHLRVSKVTDGSSTRTIVRALNHEERIQELARMLGGVDITQKTLEHAAEMLEGAGRQRSAAG